MQGLHCMHVVPSVDHVEKADFALALSTEVLCLCACSRMFLSMFLLHSFLLQPLMPLSPLVLFSSMEPRRERSRSPPGPMWRWCWIQSPTGWYWQWFEVSWQWLRAKANEGEDRSINDENIASPTRKS